MRYAILQALAFGVLAMIVAFAALEYVVLPSGASWMLQLGDVSGFTLMAGMAGAIVGFAIHPKAKDERARVFVARFVIGSGIGVNIGAYAYYLITGLSVLLDIRLPFPDRVIPIGELDAITLFVATGCWPAIFACSLVSALIAPRNTSDKALLKLAVFSSLCGVLFGAWIVAGVGLAAYQLHLIDRGCFSKDSERWLAIGAGLVAGTAIAITLRVWRSR